MAVNRSQSGSIPFRPLHNSGGRFLNKANCGSGNVVCWVGLPLATSIFMLLHLTRHIDLSDALYREKELPANSVEQQNTLPHAFFAGESNVSGIFDNGKPVDLGIGRIGMEGRSTEDAVVVRPRLSCPEGGGSHRTLRWLPRENRYLMMVCNFGQLGNRLWCTSVYLVAAALLNRTLVFPVKENDYDFSVLFDLPHISECLGNNTIISLADFKNLRNGNVNVSMLKGFAAPNGTSSASKRLRLFTRTTGVHFLQYDVAMKRDEFRSPGEFLKQFDFEDEIISFGEGFIVDFGPESWRTYTGVEQWVTNCTGPTLRPDRRILEAATGFVATYLGSRYISLHWRRKDFRTYCGQRVQRGCFHSIRQAAECIRKEAMATDIDVLFVATDALDDEYELFKKRLESGRWPMTLVRLPKELPVRKDGVWANELSGPQWGHEQTFAILDRVICALGSTFVSTHLSTFSNEINRLRRAWNLTGCRDGDICGKEDVEYTDPPWRRQGMQ